MTVFAKHMTLLHSLLKKNKMSVDDYMQSVETYRQEQEEKAKKDEIDKYVGEGIDETEAQAFVEWKLEQQKNAEQQLWLKQVKELSAEYPEASIENLPDEVFEYVSKGDTLLNAYTKYDNKRLRKELDKASKAEKITTSNSANKETAVGSLGTDANTTFDDIERMETDGKYRRSVMAEKGFEYVFKALNQKKK